MKSIVLWLIIFLIAKYANSYEIMSRYHKYPVIIFFQFLSQSILFIKISINFGLFSFCSKCDKLRIYVFLNFSINPDTLQADKVKQLQLTENADEFNSFKVKLVCLPTHYFIQSKKFSYGFYDQNKCLKYLNYKMDLRRS